MGGQRAQVRVVIAGLCKQGCRVRSQGGEHRIFLPDGKTMLTLHSSLSDKRGILNFRAQVRRAGLQWPLDHNI